MPAVSKAQQMFMGAELARRRAGQGTATGMSEAQLGDFASTARKGLPMKKGRQNKPNLQSSKEEVRKYIKGKKKK